MPPPRGVTHDEHEYEYEYEYDDEGDADDFDDLPQTHLDDDAYEEFLKRELDDAGNFRGVPPVAVVILVLAVLVLAIAVVILR